MQALRVATLNIWKKSGDWEARLPLIVRALERMQPDVVGLQEVLRLESAGQCQAREIVQALGGGYEIAFGPASDFGGGLVMGNAVLSRFPIATTSSFPLPVDRADDGRCAAYTLLRAPFGDVPFFSTHLSWRFHEGALRLRQVVELERGVSRLAPISAGHFPAIVCGDFNADADADEMRYLRGLAVVGAKSVYFADAYAWKGAAPGWTWDPVNRFTAPDLGPARRIDYILVRGPDRDGRGRVLSARLAFDRAVKDVYPSDHFGVEVELQASRE